MVTEGGEGEAVEMTRWLNKQTGHRSLKTKEKQLVVRLNDWKKDRSKYSIFILYDRDFFLRDSHSVVIKMMVIVSIL